MSTAIIGAQATTATSYEAIFGYAPMSMPSSRYFEVVQTTVDLPVLSLNKATLDRWGARYQPPQSWYEQDEEDLTS